MNPIRRWSFSQYRPGLVALVALVIMGLVGVMTVPVSAQVATRVPVTPSTICYDYSNNFGSLWTTDIGSAGSSFVSSQYDGTYTNIVQAHTHLYTDSLSDIWLSAFSVGTEKLNTNEVMFNIVLYKSGTPVYSTSPIFTPMSSTYWTLKPHIGLPTGIQSDYVMIRVTQQSDNPGAPASSYFAFQVSRLCGPELLPTPTNTPSRTPTPVVVSVTVAYHTFTPIPTNTVGPSRTPRPTNTSVPFTLTLVPAATNTRTATNTKTPTKTPTKTATATDTAIPTQTPTGTITPVTPTETPVPSDTPVPSSTATEIPTETEVPTETPAPTATDAPTFTPVPLESTLADFTYNTPPPPEAECTDPMHPCNLFPPLQLPPVYLSTPTRVALLPTLTPLPSMTRMYLSTEGTPVEIIGIVYPLMTVVADVSSSSDGVVLTDAQGTPVYVAQKAYEIGSSVGGLWSTVRGLANADVGPVGGFLLFLIALILLNIQLRILLFIVPIVIKLLEFIVGVVTKVIGVFL